VKSNLLPLFLDVSSPWMGPQGVIVAVIALVLAAAAYFALRKPALPDRKLDGASKSDKGGSPPETKQKAQPLASDVSPYRAGLTASRKGFFANLANLVSGKKSLDPKLVEELEELLITSDVGPKTTERLLRHVQSRLSKKELTSESAIIDALRQESLAILSAGAKDPAPSQSSPQVLLMVGVNGVGKTTTIGKLATKFAAENKSLLLAAGDTFRAAAGAQLEIWAKRVGAEIVLGKEGADPASVAYEATAQAVRTKKDVLLIDTAGRLHTKAPLMDEIRKVRKSIAKACPGAPHETWLVLDATTGQNALTQAKLFLEAVDVTGIVLTKLDGTAKGGIVLAIVDELSIPVKYVGLGEGADDLRIFDAHAFVDALFSRVDEAD
jgi:fused signal recognition particle receptor